MDLLLEDMYYPSDVGAAVVGDTKGDDVVGFRSGSNVGSYVGLTDGFMLGGVDV